MCAYHGAQLTTITGFGEGLKGLVAGKTSDKGRGGSKRLVEGERVSGSSFPLL